MSLASFLSRATAAVRRDGLVTTLKRLDPGTAGTWLGVRVRHYGRLVAVHARHRVLWIAIWVRDRLEYPVIWLRDRTEPLWGPLFHVGTRFQASRNRLLVLIRSRSAMKEIIARLDSPYAFCHVPPRLADAVLINGWALSRMGIVTVEAFLDGQSIGLASRGVNRPDLIKDFGFMPESWQGGFLLLWDTTAHADGDYQLSVRIVGGGGNISWLKCPVVIDNTVRAYDLWTARRSPPPPGGDDPASVDLLIDAAQATRAALDETIASVAPGSNRRVLVALPPATAAPAVPGVVGVPMDEPDAGRRLAALVGRSEAAWIGVLSPGDHLAPNAIGRLLEATDPGVGLVYADEDRIGDGGRRIDPFFKPAWSPDLLSERNYVGRPFLARRSAVSVADAPGGRDPEHDLLLRLAGSAAAVVHIPDVLCSRHLSRRSRVAPRMRPDRRPPVSLIIATRAGTPLIRRCLTAIVERTRYPDLELVVLDNARPSDTVARRFLDRFPARRLTPDGPFNWSAFNNAGAAASHGEVLVFLNDDVEPLTGDWLDPLLAHALADGIGPVGPKLLYGDDTVQHAGIFLTGQGGGGRHAFRYLRADAPGYQGLAGTTRNCAAVTGACMMIRRDRFEALGRFDEALSLTNNDVDFCLRAWTRGYRTVYTPHTRLYHHERATRRDMSESDDIRLYRSRWQWLYRLGDPFHNPNLRTDRDDLAIDPDAPRGSPRDSRLWTDRP